MGWAERKGPEILLLVLRNRPSPSGSLNCVGSKTHICCPLQPLLGQDTPLLQLTCHLPQFGSPPYYKSNCCLRDSDTTLYIFCSSSCCLSGRQVSRDPMICKDSGKSGNLFLPCCKGSRAPQMGICIAQWIKCLWHNLIPSIRRQTNKRDC